jgi:hypothetical protein
MNLKPQDRTRPATPLKSTTNSSRPEKRGLGGGVVFSVTTADNNHCGKPGIEAQKIKVFH